MRLFIELICCIRMSLSVMVVVGGGGILQAIHGVLRLGYICLNTSCLNCLLVSHRMPSVRTEHERSLISDKQYTNSTP